MISDGRATLLFPIAFARAFTAFSLVEPAMFPKHLSDVLIMVAVLGPAYLYIAAALGWVVQWDGRRRFRGLSRKGWLLLIPAAYLAGVACVVALAIVERVQQFGRAGGL